MVFEFFYVICHSTREDYRNRHAVGELGPFRFTLEGRTATFTSDAFETRAAAQKELEARIHAWNIAALLRLGPEAFQLRKPSAVIGDDGPPAPAPSILHEAYPAPEDLAVNLCVSELADAYEDMLTSPQHLVRGGQACIAALESWYGDRAAAANALNVDVKVLNRLSALTRRWGRDASGKPRFSTWRAPRWLSAAERAWLTQVARELTYRAAEHAAGRTPAAPLNALPS